MFLGRSQKVFDPKKLKARREEVNMTVQQLSEATGLKKRIIYRMEREEDAMLNVEQISILAEALDCSIEDFLVDGVEIRVRTYRNRKSEK